MKNSITQLLVIALLLALAAFVLSCSTGGDEEDPEPTDPCTNGPKEVEISDYLHSFTGKSTGTFTVGASGGNGTLEYSIDGENFSESSTFSGLGSGKYTITVKDDSSCTATLEYEVLEFPEVSFASDIKPIIDTNCQKSGCHGSASGLPSWNSYATIKANADKIRFMVTQKNMPPASSGGSLSDQQITAIQNWVDVGAPNN